MWERHLFCDLISLLLLYILLLYKYFKGICYFPSVPLEVNLEVNVTLWRSGLPQACGFLVVFLAPGFRGNCTKHRWAVALLGRYWLMFFQRCRREARRPTLLLAPVPLLNSTPSVLKFTFWGFLVSLHLNLCLRLAPSVFLCMVRDLCDI